MTAIRSASDLVERVLSAQKRRVVAALLEDRTIPADPILREGEMLDADEHQTVCYELHHVVLPELAARGLIEFDRGADEIRRGTRFAEVVRPSEGTESGPDVTLD